MSLSHMEPTKPKLISAFYPDWRTGEMVSMS